jgi:hypothetical protein
LKWSSRLTPLKSTRPKWLYKEIDRQRRTHTWDMNICINILFTCISSKIQYYKNWCRTKACTFKGAGFKCQFCDLLDIWPQARYLLTTVPPSPPL